MEAWAGDRVKLNPIYPTAPLPEEDLPEPSFGEIIDRKMLDYYTGAKVMEDSPKEESVGEEREDSGTQAF